MTFDPWGSATASWREKCERISSEVLRRVRVLAQNDPTVVPPVDDVSAMLASRSFAVPLVVPPPAPDDTSTILASRIFSRAFTSQADHKLTIGTHLTGGSYDGSADVTIATDATPVNTANTIIARDASGNFAAGTMTGNATTATTAVNQSGGTLNATQLKLTSGANARVGGGTLVAGAATIANTSVTASSVIFLQLTGARAANMDALTVVSKTAGVGFVVNSANAADVSNFQYWILEV